MGGYKTPLPFVNYTIELTRQASAEFDALPKKIKRQFADIIDELAINPFPAQVIALKNQKVKLFRIRQGDYRLIYTFISKEKKILILHFGHRSKVYKNLK